MEAIVQDRIRGSLIGGAIGDALGYPIEFIFSYKTIQARYGENGITRLDTHQHWLPEEEQVGIDEVDIDEAVRSIEQEVSRAAKPEPALDLDLSDFDLSPAPKKKNLSSTQSFNL